MQRGQDAAAIIIFDDLQRVLLVHQTYGDKLWSLPGGMVEETESSWAAAKRELKEEANICVNEMELSGLYFQPHRNRYVHIFKACNYEGTIEVDHKEIDEYGFFGMDRLPSPITSFTVGRIMDAIHNNKGVFREEKRI